MQRTALLFLLCLPIQAFAQTDVPSDLPRRPSSIIVLDDCDDQYQGKAEYKDNMTFFDSTGKKKFLVSGLNNCESIGSNHLIAPDPARHCIWVLEYVPHRLRRFDDTGKETSTINNVDGFSIAIDPDKGTIWVLDHKGKVFVYDEKGKVIAKHNVGGWDIVYDQKAKAFWIGGRHLTKIAAANGEVQFTIPITNLGIVPSLDVDQQSGAAWITVREKDDTENKLFRVDANGSVTSKIELGRKRPYRVSVNSRDGTAWVAHLNTSVERFSAKGKSEVEYPIQALTIQFAANTQDVWVVTSTEVQKIDLNGQVINRSNLVGKTTQAWIAYYGPE